MDVSSVAVQREVTQEKSTYKEELHSLLNQMKEFLKESEIRSRSNKEETNRIKQELVETRRKLTLLL